MALFCCIHLSGCASIDAEPVSVASASPAPPLVNQASSKVDTAKLAAEGIRYLKLGDAERAARLFNAAIKFDSERAEYHLLVGIAYHLQFLDAGSTEMRDNAQIGYQLAARFDPRNPQPWVQLGRLHTDAKQYAEANSDFAKAAELLPGAPDALVGLATTSYVTGDLKTALWASSELERIGWEPAMVSRMRAVLFTAAAETEQASQHRDAYAKSLAAHPGDLKDFDARIAQIKAVLDGQSWLTQPGHDKLTSTQVGLEAARRPVVTPPHAAVDQQAQQLIRPVMMQAGQGFSLTAPAASGMTKDVRPRKPWFDCGGFAPTTGMGGMGMMQSGMQGAATGEETTALAALPAPCDGAGQPRMAVIDAVLLRTEDEVARSHGINLLQGLTGFFGVANFNVHGSSGQTEARRTTFSGLGGNGSGANGAASLMYALNIANATNTRNEVLARPTLMAVDRMPSTFFSGSTVSIAISGSAGSSGMLVDKPIGVSFSITPTIIDDDSLMLSVKAVRSFVQSPAKGTTGVALSVSRNSVTANVTARFGETVILGGLSERELFRSNSGVPVLKDLPGIQYMFSENTTTDFFRTVMIMITPRKSVTNDADVEAARNERNASKLSGQSIRKKYAFYWRVEEYEKVLAKYAPNLDATMDTLETNELYKSFKAKDLVDTNWAAKPRLEVLLYDLGKVLWH